MYFRQIVDEKLAQYAYLIGCQQTGEALLIDPERDIDRYVEMAERESLNITAVAETHIHADFLSGARELAEHYDVKLYLSDEGGEGWKYQWAGGYDVQLLKDGDTFTVGNIEVQAVHTPGHTPEHLSYLITDRGGGADEPRGIASGDFVFVGDTGRPDLLETAAGHEGVMEPSARRLYHSVQHFLHFPDYMQVWPGHGAGSACGKALGAVPDTTVGYEKRFSSAFEAARDGEDAFVEYILEDQPEPPLYFGRMKTLNKEGPPLLGNLPKPRAFTTEQLGDLSGRDDLAVIDARPDREAFMQGHLPGATCAPLDRTFPTVAGSYVEADIPIYLIIAGDQVEEAVRNLIRIGLDRIEGYATPETLAKYAEQGGKLASTEMIDFEELERRRMQKDAQVLDVRGLSEFQAGHVPGALHIAHTRLFDRLGEVPADKELLVHCGSGMRASGAVSLLERTRHQVTHVNDRFARWARAHPGDVEKSKKPVAA